MKTWLNSPMHSLIWGNSKMKTNNKLTIRRERLLPGGQPRWVRIYDNKGKTLDRFTCVFTGRYAEKIPNYGRLHWYLHMNAAPFWPQGICMSGESNHLIDRPTSSHLGKRIKFADLNEDCQKAILQSYRAIWSLEGK